MGATLDKYHSVMLLKSITIKSMVLDHRASKLYVLYLIHTCGNTRERKKRMKLEKEIASCYCIDLCTAI